MRCGRMRLAGTDWPMDFGEQASSDIQWVELRRLKYEELYEQLYE